MHRLVVLAISLIVSESSLIRIPIPQHHLPSTNVTKLPGTPSRRSAYILTTTDSSTLSVLYGTDLERTSRHANCEYATNGGPFQRDGTAVGVVITHGVLQAKDFHGNNIGFGRTRTDWVLGSMEQGEDVDIEEFVTGFDWLVYNGTAKVGNDTTGALRAPRTAIGLDHRGHLILMVVDGCEFWYVVHKCTSMTNLMLAANVSVASTTKDRHF